MRMHPLSGLSLLALVCGACGPFVPPPTAPYSADRLNAVTGRIVDDEPATSGSAAPSGPSGEAGEAAPPPAPAGLRVIHAAPDRALASVSAFVDDSAVAAVQGLAFKAVAGHLELTPGEHPLVLRRAADAATAAPALAIRTPALAAGTRYTAIVHGLATGTPRLAVAASADSPAEPEAGKARVRFFHALAGLGAVDLCLPARPARPAAANQPAAAAVPAAPVFANVAYGAFGSVQGSEFTEVVAGAPVALTIRAQNARPCTGAVRGTVTVTPASGAVLTAVAVGRVVGAPAVARELLVCTDAPLDGAPSCPATPIR